MRAVRERERGGGETGGEGHRSLGDRSLPESGGVPFIIFPFFFFVPWFETRSLSPSPPFRLFEMEEESDGPDVVAIGRRETAAGAEGAAGAGAATDARRRAPSALAGINPLSSSSLGGEQQQQELQEEPLLPLLTKNQRHKLRQKRCRLAKRLTMQVRVREKRWKKHRNTSPPPRTHASPSC